MKSEQRRKAWALIGSPLAEGRELKSVWKRMQWRSVSSPLAEGRELK